MKNSKMANLGRSLEERIKTVCQEYQLRKIARIDKVPTEWTVIRSGKKITKAFPHKNKLVDFVGVIGIGSPGKTVSFDAKETSEKTAFPLKNIDPDQIEYMQDTVDMGGISFLIIEWKNHRKVYFLPYSVLKVWWDQSVQGGRKSIPYGNFESDSRITEIKRLDFIRNIIDYIQQGNKQ